MKEAEGTVTFFSEKILNRKVFHLPFLTSWVVTSVIHQLHSLVRSRTWLTSLFPLFPLTKTRMPMVLLVVICMVDQMGADVRKWWQNDITLWKHFSVLDSSKALKLMLVSFESKQVCWSSCDMKKCSNDPTSSAQLWRISLLAHEKDSFSSAPVQLRLALKAHTWAVPPMLELSCCVPSECCKKPGTMLAEHWQI